MFSDRLSCRRLVRQRRLWGRYLQPAGPSVYTLVTQSTSETAQTVGQVPATSRAFSLYISYSEHIRDSADCGAGTCN